MKYQFCKPRFSMLLAALIAIGGASACLTDGPGGERPPPLAPGQVAALVVTTDYSSGAYSVITTWDLAVYENAGLIHQDAVCRFDPASGLPFVVARLGADALDLIDPAQGWEVVSEYSVGAGTNLQDIAVAAPERAYVSRLNHAELLVVDPLSGTEIDRVDLAPYADGDGIPEAAWLLPRAGRIFVTLLRLENLQPSGQSTIAVIDGASGQVQDTVQLVPGNPFGKLRYSPGLERITVAQMGQIGILDGRLSLLDPIALTLDETEVTEQSLGGDLIDAVVPSWQKGYAILGIPTDQGATTRLVSFDPQNGTVLQVLIDSSSWTLASLELTPDQTQLWVADQTRTAPGIRIFDLASDVEQTATPLDVGLPPFAICFVQPGQGG